VGRACSANGGEEKCIYDIGGKARKIETTRIRRSWVDNIKIDLKRDRVVWTELFWLRIGTSEWLLCTQYLNFGFHIILENSCVCAQPVAPWS
jgi:hypothetical protein